MHLDLLLPAMRARATTEPSWPPLADADSIHRAMADARHGVARAVCWLSDQAFAHEVWLAVYSSAGCIERAEALEGQLACILEVLVACEGMHRDRCA